MIKKKQLSDKEVSLDKQLNYWRKQKDTLTKATTYLKEQANIDQLIDKYSAIAQMASNYLYNEYCLKFTKLGGYANWQLQQWKENQSNNVDYELESLYSSYFDSEEFNQLSDLEKREIMLDYEEKFGHDDNNKENIPVFTDVFTMKDLYSILNLDYELVYPPSK